MTQGQRKLLLKLLSVSYDWEISVWLAGVDKDEARKLYDEDKAFRAEAMKAIAKGANAEADKDVTLRRRRDLASERDLEQARELTTGT